jgi:hypothetical protein
VTKIEEGIIVVGVMDMYVANADAYAWPMRQTILVIETPTSFSKKGRKELRRCFIRVPERNAAKLARPGKLAAV